MNEYEITEEDLKKDNFLHEGLDNTFKKLSSNFDMRNIYLLIQENQKLKERWQNLKKYIEQEMEIDKRTPGYESEYYIIEEEGILAKMKELEEGNEHENNIE